MTSLLLALHRGMDQAISFNPSNQSRFADAKVLHETRKSVGFDQEALELAARACFSNGAFEETDDDLPDVLEEFFPEEGEETTTSKVASKGKPSLLEKLDSKAGGS